MKTSKLTGAALDWAVAKCELLSGADYTLEIDKDVDGTLRINFGGMYPEWSTESTSSVNCLRCYVASCLGEDVEVPEELGINQTMER